MPETCENWLGVVKSCVHYAYQTLEIYQALPNSVDFKAPEALWNSLSKTVLIKCCFIWSKGPVNVWNNRKTQMLVVRRICKYVSHFDTAMQWKQRVIIEPYYALLAYFDA